MSLLLQNMRSNIKKPKQNTKSNTYALISFNSKVNEITGKKDYFTWSSIHQCNCTSHPAPRSSSCRNSLEEAQRLLGPNYNYTPGIREIRRRNIGQYFGAQTVSVNFENFKNMQEAITDQSLIYSDIEIDWEMFNMILYD